MTGSGALALRLRAAGQLAWLLARSTVSPRRRAARRQHTRYYRRLWSDAAATVGVPVRDVGDGGLEIDLGSGCLEVKGTHCSIDDRATLDRAGDKALVHRLLAERGVPMPTYEVFTLADLEPARRFLAAAPGACVVKPAVDGAVGRGVVTGLRHEADLAPAAVAAAAAGGRASRRSRTGTVVARLARMLADVHRVPLLIEHQVAGENYRLLYLDGVLIDAIRRGSPTLAGDGRHRVGELVARMNAERVQGGGERGQMLVSTDLDYERTVAAQGLTPDSVPASGAVVRLKTTINESAPENSHPARDVLCDAVVEQGRLAATTVGARWAGVDVITADPGVALEQAGGVVVEVNTTPGLSMHLHGRPGEVNPAVALLRSRPVAPRDAAPAPPGSEPTPVTLDAGIVGADDVAPGFARTAASTLGYRLSTAAMSFVSVLITARALGATERGQLALLIAIATISAQLGRFAVEEANANLGAGEPGMRRALATNSVVFSCVFGALCALVIVVLFKLVPAAHGDTPARTWWLAIATIPVLMLQAYLTYLVRADYGFRVTNVSWLMGPGIAMVGNAILWVTGELTVSTAFTSWIVAHSAACLLLVVYVVRRSVGFGRPDRELARRTLRFGLKAYVGRVLLVGNYRVDQWILAGIAGPRELGLYSIAVAWGEVLFYLPTVLMIVQRPYLVRASEGDAARRSAIAFRIGIMCTAPAAAAMIVAAPVLCGAIFGEEFVGAVDDLRLLALGAFGIVAMQQLGDALTARGAPLRSSAAIGVAFVATIALDLLLIPEMGGGGAALASALAYTAGGSAVAVLYLRYFDVSVRELVPRPSELAAYARGLGRRAKPQGL